MSLMKLFLFTILLLVLAEGCISPPVKTGDPGLYEFPGLVNNTIFYLNLSSTRVVDNVNYKLSVDLPLEGNIESFKYPAAVDYFGNNVSVNVSILQILGKNYAHFNFSSNFSGFIGYSIPGTQDFSYIPAGNGTIRVVLPRNYTTGTLFLGYIKPTPDNITQDATGRDVLIWTDPKERIRVKYYHRDTPGHSIYLSLFLLISAIIIWGYYYFSVRALSKKRKMLERDIRK